MSACCTASTEFVSKVNGFMVRCGIRPFYQPVSRMSLHQPAICHCRDFKTLLVTCHDLRVDQGYGVDHKNQISASQRLQVWLMSFP